MEFSKHEVEALVAAENHAGDKVKELIDLELALVGGGMGDVSFG